MMYQTIRANNIFSTAKQSFKMGIRKMDVFQSQAEEAIELAMNNTSNTQEATRKAYNVWSENMDNARETYISAIEDGFDYLERQFSDPNPKPKAK